MVERGTVSFMQRSLKIGISAGRTVQTHLVYAAFSSRLMTRSSGRQQDLVNRRWLRRLIRQKRLGSTYAKSNLSRAHPQHAGCLKRLRELDVTRPNRVWAMDITCLPIDGASSVSTRALMVHPGGPSVEPVEHP